MKVFVIKNKISEDIFIVGNKKRFCAKFNLTPRLLDYTVEGASSTRFQEWHKNYKIVDKFVFIEDKQGDRVLWDNGLVGYCVKEDGEHFKDKPKAKTVEMESEIEALQKELTKTMKQKQKLQDQLNLNRKLGREQYRYENFIDVFRESCKEMIESGVPVCKDYYIKKGNETAILMLSDLHFGEIIDEINNSFDLEIAEDRLSVIFSKFKKEVDLRGIKDVHLFLLGDFIFASNPITRPDMKASSVLPEINAGIHCFKVLASQIDDLVKKYNVNISGIVGNESRFHNGIHMSTLQSEAKNNVDTMIYEMLMQRYRNTLNVKFIGNGDCLEEVVEVNGNRFLLIHGHQKYVKHANLEKSFIEIKARLEDYVGEIDYMCLGHIHSTLISNRVFRNGSLPSSNSYSNELGFSKSYVSQNMLIVRENEVYCIALEV